MVAYTRVRIERLLKIEFFRFCIVGGSGFILNFVILISLHKFLHVPIFIAQLVGAEIALFSNFILHHTWTYKAHKVKKTILSLVIQFHATTWPAIVGSALMVAGGVRLLHLSSLIALTISSVIALLWNFGWSKYVIWRDTSAQEIKEIVN